MDSRGRIVVPKPLRDALGLVPGATVDVSVYGSGLRIVPGGRTARIEQGSHGRLVAKAETVITDNVMFDLIDSRRS
ncbi:AbrB/MazE/SpoVT family DNA-binding domain-containing protein [Mycobacterium sp. C31M]